MDPSNAVKIGCVVMVKWNDRIVAIECSKKRGYIMPGGKWNPGETFMECARREFMEETGMDPGTLILVFQGMSEEGYYTYAFQGRIRNFTPTDSAEGNVVLTDWHTLCQSRFKGYYELMRHILGD